MAQTRSNDTPATYDMARNRADSVKQNATYDMAQTRSNDTPATYDIAAQQQRHDSNNFQSPRTYSIAAGGDLGQSNTDDTVNRVHL